MLGNGVPKRAALAFVLLGWVSLARADGLDLGSMDASQLGGVDLGSVDPATLDPSIVAQIRSQLEAVQAQATEQLSPLATPITKVLGILTDHRPLEPATSLLYLGPDRPRIGMDLGISAVIIKPPSDFGSSLSSSGGATGILSALSSLPFLPMARIHLHKGITKSFDLGASWIGFSGYSIIGADIKWTFIQPDEGPSIAARLCFATSKLLYFQTTTWSPQILLSRRLSFADPYIGIVAQYVTGKIAVPIPYGSTEATKNAATLGLPSEISVSATPSFAFVGMLGLGLSFTPFKLSIEMAYSSVTMPHIATKISINM